MLNEVTLIGNIGADPEVRNFQNGGKVANLRIATSERWKSKDGEQKEHTEWHSVAVFGPLADVVEKYATKGMQVLIRGSLRTRSYEKDGSTRYVTEVVVQGFNARFNMLGGKNGGGGSRSEGGGWDSGGARGGSTSSGTTRKPASDLDDDIPW